MSSTYLEGNLEFTFGDGWNVVKYDDESGWYRRTFERALNGTAAVDFVAVFRERQVFFIEVTDARGHAISSKQAQRRESLDQETGRKVRDTVAGIVGARRTEPDNPFWAKVHRVLADSNRAVGVVLWHEPAVGGRHDVRKRTKGALDVLSKSLKRRLRWLVPGRLVSVTGLREAGVALPHITVRNAAGAVQQRSRQPGARG